MSGSKMLIGLAALADSVRAVVISCALAGLANRVHKGERLMDVVS
jgi:hypothetical protein